MLHNNEMFCHKSGFSLYIQYYITVFQSIMHYIAIMHLNNYVLVNYNIYIYIRTNFTIQIIFKYVYSRFFTHLYIIHRALFCQLSSLFLYIVLFFYFLRDNVSAYRFSMKNTHQHF